MRADVLLVCIVALGIASRVVHTGWIVFDKYLGDALYAAMAYTLIGMVTCKPPVRKAAIAMSIMTAIELFQLTMIPAHLARSPHFAVRVAARLLGAQFSFIDLFAYAVGIFGVFLLDRKQYNGRVWIRPG